MLTQLGYYGLIMAKTYRDANPAENVVILDRNGSVGGVWSQERSYPTLKSNNMLGTYERSDFPMDTATYGVEPGEHIPAEAMHKYLCNFAEKFDLTRRIRFGSEVEVVEKGPKDSWILTMKVKREKEASTTSKLTTKKLVIATGLCHEPNLPKFKGGDSFDRPIYHFPSEHHLVEKATKNVAVLGGAKSGWDAAYAYASKGVHVEWVIRGDGSGPSWMAPPYVTPLKRWLEELVSSRLLTWFSPCVWGDADRYGRIRKWLHQTSIGRFIVDKFGGSWEMILSLTMVTINIQKRRN